MPVPTQMGVLWEWSCSVGFTVLIYQMGGICEAMLHFSNIKISPLFEACFLGECNTLRATNDKFRTFASVKGDPLYDFHNSISPFLLKFQLQALWFGLSLCLISFTPLCGCCILRLPLILMTSAAAFYFVSHSAIDRTGNIWLTLNFFTGTMT